jgi:type II secretory pathway pseudopilin PulG
MLEIVIALMILTVVFVGVAPMVTASFREERMRGVMESLAEVVREQRVAAEAGGEERRIVVTADGLEQIDEKSGEAVVLLDAPTEGVLTVRLPGQRKWEKPDGQVWRFFAAGMVTPFSVRLVEGDSWVESDFDFLTGRVADQRYSF